MTGAAFLFPGQGAQSVGMGSELAERFEICRRTFEEASEALGFALSRLCFQGPESELVKTANTQPALLAVAIAIDRLLASLGLRPSLAAGHSLGEYAALVSAEVLTFPDALRAVRLRGEAMQEAVPAGQGAMAAILGLSPHRVEEACRESAGDEVVSPANYNSPDQTVIAGQAGAVRRASALSVEFGAMRAVPLAVSAPFHCALMRPAERRLAEHLEHVSFSDPVFPVVANSDARPVTTGSGAREALVRQVCSPVRWVDSVLTLRQMGADLFIEVGSGRVLTGLMRRIDRTAEAANVEDSRTLDSLLGRLALQPPPGNVPNPKASAPSEDPS